MFRYWKKNGAIAGCYFLIQQHLGQVITDHLDVLARNAFFTHPAPALGLASATSFSGIASTDVLNTDLLDSVWLSLRDRQRPFSALPTTFPVGDEIFCITTAGAVHDLKRELTGESTAITFIDAHKYAQPSPLIRGELGMWRGVRFVDNPFAKLWNCGVIEVQAEIGAAVQPGDGAADPELYKVEGVRMVGQPGATHSITVDDSAGFAPNDMVSIHLLRHDSASVLTYGGRGTIDGPKYDDSMKQDVEIYSVPDSTHLVLKEPYMMSDQDGAGLETDLGGTVYGYVTKAATIHSALFLVSGLSNNGLVAGVAQPPNIYTPPAIDDYESVMRVAYDFYLKYALWEPRAFNLAFLRGSNSVFGKAIFK